MPPRAREQSGSNGPGKEKFLDMLADYEEQRFEVMRATSLAGKVLAEWERWGGNKADLRDGYSLRQMEPSEQKAELQRQFRVAGWLGIVDEDATGQRGFLKVFDQSSTPDALGLGGAPFGTKLSTVRARTTGFNEGKAKNGPTMQEGLAHYSNELGWEADSQEALAYCGGFGDGLRLRPPPKARKSDADSGGDSGEDSDDREDAAAPETERIVSLPRRRGRPQKSAVDEMAERAQAMDNGGRGPATTTDEAAGGLAASPPADDRPGWRGDRDFSGPADIVTADD